MDSNSLKQRVLYGSIDGPTRGVVYSAKKTYDYDAVPKKAVEFKESEKKKILSGDIPYQDPLEEDGYRAIPYLASEINSFETFLVKNLPTLKNINSYSAKSIKRDTTNKEEERFVIQGSQQIDDIDQRVWDDPFCFIDGNFKNQMRNLDVIRQILISFLPLTVEADMIKRKRFTKEAVIVTGNMAGVKFALEKPIGKNRSKPDYLVLEFRLSDVTPEQHLLDKERNKTLREEVSTSDHGELMAFLEDRMIFNVLLLPKEDLYTIGCVFFNT
jgi:hypothetical protein